MGTKTIASFEQMLSNDECAAAIGRNLGNNLRLRRDDHCTDRWSTNWGSKTNAGLARIIFSQMMGSVDEYERNATKDLADRAIASFALDELKRRHPEWVFAKNEPEVHEETPVRYLGDGVYGKVEFADGTVKIWLDNGDKAHSFITLEPSVLLAINQLSASAK